MLLANPKRDAELLRGERKYLNLSSRVHLLASLLCAHSKCGARQPVDVAKQRAQPRRENGC